MGWQAPSQILQLLYYKENGTFYIFLDFTDKFYLKAYLQPEDHNDGKISFIAFSGEELRQF